MNIEQMDSGKITFEFHGSALGFFGRGLLMGLAYIIVIPVPWAMAWLYRWFVDNLQMSDNTQISFVGTGKQIWLPVISLGLINVFGYFLPDGWSFLLTIVTLPFSCFVWILIMRWICGNIVLSEGPTLSFQGKFLPYLGWIVLMFLSVFTIIGWAWVTVAFYRWMCRNVYWEGHLVEFNGSGWELFWRMIVMVLSCLLIIPIPWIVLWFTKWIISNIAVRPVIATEIQPTQ